MSQAARLPLAVLSGVVLACMISGLIAGWVAGVALAAWVSLMCAVTFGTGDIMLALAPPFTLVGMTVGAVCGGVLGFLAWIRRA